MFDQIKKIIKYLLNAKLFLGIPTKSDIIIYDRQRFEEIKYSLNTKKKIDILDVRGESFYIIFLIINFFKLKFSLKNYFETYINFSKPDFVITLRDNDVGFFKLKLKTTKKILIQQSWKNRYDNIFKTNLDEKKNVNKKYKIDYIFCFNKHIKKKLSEIIEGNFLLAGSLKSNNLIKISNNQRKNGITFISEGDGNELKFTHPKFYKATEKILKSLLIYSKKNNCKLFVYGKNDSFELEKKFYDEKLNKKNYSFVPNFKINPIKYTDNSNIIITSNSTLGYESFSRGNKTIFLNFRQFIEEKSLKFGWPKNFLNEGPFWTSKIDFLSISKLINKVDKMSNLTWKMIVKKYSSDLICKDYNNSKLKKLVNFDYLTPQRIKK